MRADDLKAEVPGDGLILEIDRAAAAPPRPGERPFPREQQRELQVGIAGLGIERDRTLEHRNGGREIALADPHARASPWSRLTIAGSRESPPGPLDRLIGAAEPDQAEPSHIRASASSGSIASARRSVSIDWFTISGMLRELPLRPYAPPSAAQAWCTPDRERSHPETPQWPDRSSRGSPTAGSSSRARSFRRPATDRVSWRSISAISVRSSATFRPWLNSNTILSCSAKIVVDRGRPTSPCDEPHRSRPRRSSP